MKAIKREYLNPLDLTGDFKAQCRLVITSLEKAIGHADEECPYEAEYWIDAAFREIRKARQIVNTVADNYDATASAKGKKEA